MLLLGLNKGIPLQKTHMQESAPWDLAGNTSVKMVRLGHLTWLSVKMVVRSPNLSQNCGGHILNGEAMFFEPWDF